MSRYFVLYSAFHNRYERVDPNPLGYGAMSLNSTLGSYVMSCYRARVCVCVSFKPTVL